MFSRLAALLRSRRFGIYLTGPKQDAILRGDISNTVVHPLFVHVMTVLGMHFCAVECSPRMLRLRARYAQRVFEQLVDIITGNNANLLVQVLLYIATMSLHARFFKFTREYLTKVGIALNAANIRFIPATGRPPGLTEDVRERVVVLSQIIYLESFMFLAVDGTEPKITARIEKEFRHELQVRVRLLTSCSVG